MTTSRRREPRSAVPAAGRGYRPGRVQRQRPGRRQPQGHERLRVPGHAGRVLLRQDQPDAVLLQGRLRGHDDRDGVRAEQRVHRCCGSPARRRAATRGTSRSPASRSQHSDWNLVNVAGSAFKQAQQGNLGASVYAKGNFHVYYYRNVDVTPGIIQIQNADGILLQRNRIQHTGADGINMVNDVQNTQLIGNFTNDIAGSAITVGHPQHVYIGDYTSTNHEKYSAQVEGLSQEHRDQEQLPLRQRRVVQRAQPHLGVLRRHADRAAQPDREGPVVGHHARLGMVELRRIVGLDRARTGRPPRRGTTPSATTRSSTRCSASATRRPSTRWAASREPRSPTTTSRAFRPATSTDFTRTKARRTSPSATTC